MDSIFPAVLRAIASSDEGRVPADATVAEPDQARLERSGLGPVLHHLRPPEGYRIPPSQAARLHGADLTSRSLTAHLLEGVAEVLERLRTVDITPVVLKGLSYATRHYPAPHLRVMRDVDLLVAADDLARAQEALRTAGFQEPRAEIPGHHHAPDLHHPTLGLWVELHHRLRPPDSPSAAEPPLDLSQGPATEPGRLAGADVRFLSPEVELALIADHWCHDLKTRFGVAGLERPLVDTVFLLRVTGARFDWDKVLAWAEGRYVGTCLTILATTLTRVEAWPGPAEIPGRLLASQPYVNRRTLQAITGIVHRYVVEGHPPGRLASSHNIASALGALIAPRRPARNALSVPFAVAFPGGRAERFDPRFVLRRLRSALRAR